MKKGHQKPLAKGEARSSRTKGLCRPGLLTPKTPAPNSSATGRFSLQEVNAVRLDTEHSCSLGLLGTHRGAARWAPAEVAASSPCTRTSSVGPRTASPT